MNEVSNRGNRKIRSQARKIRRVIIVVNFVLDFPCRGSIALSAIRPPMANDMQPADRGLWVVLVPIGVPDKGVPSMARDQEKRAGSTKAAKITSLLMRNNGATLDEISRSVDWQPHSVRGFMSGTLKKKLGLEVTSKREDGKALRYFITRGTK